MFYGIYGNTKNLINTSEKYVVLGEVPQFEYKPPPTLFKSIVLPGRDISSGEKDK